MKLFKSLTAKKHIPRSGDLFVFSIEERFGYGRVINANLTMGRLTKSKIALTYFYDVFQSNIFPVPVVSPQNLIVPPDLLLHSAWNTGAFLTLSSAPIQVNEVLPQHCFLNHNIQSYVNEYGEPLTEKSDPCGIYAMGGVESVEIDIGILLGVIPDDQAWDALPHTKVAGLPKNQRIIEVRVSALELNEAGIGVDELRESIRNLVAKNKLGTWFEAGSEPSFQVTCVSVPLTKLNAFSNSISELFRVNGIRNYNIRDLVEGREL
jgi:hypothetical protein